MIKKFRYFLEYLLVKAWLGVIKILGLEVASNFASKFFQFIGMKLKVSNVARNNIKMIFPEWSHAKVERIVLDVWDNFGRMASETPIFMGMSETKLNQYVKIIGIENFYQVKGKPAIFFGAHQANWEMANTALAFYGARFHAVYRSANNKLVDKIINDLRRNTTLGLIPKGKDGAKKIISVLKNNEHIVMLLDQKMNDGIKIPFLGKDAMTAPAIATLALKYDCPIIPIQVIRKNNFYFDIIIHPALQYQEKKVKTIMEQINDQIGEWVRANPGQWFWLHRRWIDSSKNKD